MTACSDLEPILRAAADGFGWRCRAAADGRAELTTDRLMADSEPVVVFVSYGAGEGEMVLGDGGRTIARLDDAEFGLDDATNLMFWQESLLTYRISQAAAHLYVRTERSRAAYDLHRFADALVAIDGLRVLAAPPPAKSRTLADEVGDYLKGASMVREVRRQPRVRLDDGVVVHPALSVVTTDAETVLIQPGSTADVRQSYEHAYTLMSLAGGTFDLRHRLVVLGGSLSTWNLAEIGALSRHAYVGMWREPDSLVDFIGGDVPDTPFVAPTLRAAMGVS